MENRPRRGALAAFALLVLAAAIIGWPLRRGSFYLDDYVFVALSRHIASPLPLLLQDSLGAFFFRPVGVFSWWASVAAFGNTAPWHYAVNLALHAANGALLFALLRRFAVGPRGAAAVALAVVAHPAMFGTAAWLSDRFDLLSATFGLVALIAAVHARHRTSLGAVALLAVAACLAMLSKENGFAFAVTAAVVLAVGGSGSAPLRRRAAAIGAVVGCMAAVLLVRSVVLRDVGEVSLLRDGLAPTLAGGVAKWLRHLPDFLVVRQGNPAAMWAWAVAFAALLAAAVRPSAVARLRGPTLLLLVTGASLALAGALSQAPIVHASAITPFVAGIFAFDSLGGCRFYYVPLLGIACAVAALLHAAAVSFGGQRWTSVAGAGIAAIAIVSLATGSRAMARAWAAYPQEHGAAELARLVETIAARTELRPGCKIYVLDLPARAEPLRGLIDTAVKHALPRGHAALACFIQTEATPWYHLVRRDAASLRAALPLEPMLLAGKVYPPLDIGNLTYFYLKAVDGAGIVADTNATFYAFAGGALVDVTADVRSRRRTPTFIDNRPRV